jgi:hypothetical protein
MATRELAAGERHWLAVRDYLRQHRYELTARAAGLWPAAYRVAGTPLLGAPGWQPAGPVPLTAISLELRPPPAASGLDGAADHVLPDGYRRYSDAMGALAAPTVFENRPTYRLTRAALDAADPGLVFGMGRYFDTIDYGEAAAHEFAASKLAGASGASGGPDASGAGLLRAALGDPFDLARHPVNLAVTALTLRLDRRTGAATFLLHWRDPAKVGHAGGLHQVVPVGVFQPSGDAAWNEQNDFSLWRCLVREYAEELAGHDEDYGTGQRPLDYAAWPFAQRMTAALDAGLVRAWCLGLGVDPLSYAGDLLAVVVIDSAVYEELFGAGAGAYDNAEGRVLAARAFDEDVVSRTVSADPLQAAGAAVLRLAWANRDVLVGRQGLEP